MSPADRRAAIVRAVVPLIIEHGDAVSTRQIAEAAGIAEGTIFRVFPDKGALLMAAAAETLNPAGEREALEAALAGADGLEQRVRIAADRLVERSQQVMAVMMSLRRLWTPPADEHAARGPQRHVPPTFVVEAHAALLERLALVFEPHREELSVPPERAAVILRALVLGARHPGDGPGDRLDSDEVVAVLLHGIGAPAGPVGRG